jgi:hypothetical protein
VCQLVGVDQGMKATKVLETMAKSMRRRLADKTVLVQSTGVGGIMLVVAAGQGSIANGKKKQGKGKIAMRLMREI